MRQSTETIIISTSGAGLYEFTDKITKFVAASGIQTGLMTIFVQHTSASLLIQENADPEVRRDLERYFHFS
jgi:secondary thiamine-phosphate synthase enzyme